MSNPGMSDTLNQTLALGKQAYDELMQLTSLGQLERNEFGIGGTRGRIAELLKSLNTIIHTVDRILSEHVGGSSEPPVISLPARQRMFYNEVIQPKGKALQRAYFEISGLGKLVGLLQAHRAELREPRILNAISLGLERWRETLDKDEQFDWLERGFNIEDAQDLVGMPWFQPDEWFQNLKLLQPVLVDRPPHVMRDHVRYRLTEIYRAFTYGLWMAAIALSRSLVDFSLRANAPRFGISITYPGTGGRSEDRSLKQIGEDIAKRVPSLRAPIKTVRETGNRILHPTKRDVIARPKVMRAEALECIRAAQLIIETLYSDSVPEE